MNSPINYDSIVLRTLDYILSILILTFFLVALISGNDSDIILLLAFSIIFQILISLLMLNFLTIFYGFLLLIISILSIIPYLGYLFIVLGILLSIINLIIKMNSRVFRVFNYHYYNDQKNRERSRKRKDFFNKKTSSKTGERNSSQNKENIVDVDYEEK